MVKPSSQKKKDQTRTRILEAADAVFVRRGIDGARMQEIADQARVNKALLHYYFQSKIGLARAVWFRIAASFVPGVFQMLASDLSLDEKIKRFVDTYHAVLTRHPYLMVFALSEAARRPELVHDFYSVERRQAARRMIAKLQKQIDERAKRTKSRPVPAKQFFVTLVGSCLFPFASRALLVEVVGLSPAELPGFMERRRKDLPVFLKRALQ
jgi:AcrR family transcriptional regulator